jgi:hypothetical protein
MAFTLVLLAKTDDPARLEFAATHAGWLQPALNIARTSCCPVVLLTGLTPDDALLAQFELACCDSAAVFVRDEVVAEGDQAYLSRLYRELSTSEEFQDVRIEVHDVPEHARGQRFLLQFLGTGGTLSHCMRFPLHLKVMRKKARIMCYWGHEIGADVRMAGP